MRTPAFGASPDLLGAPAARLQGACRRLAAEEESGEAGLALCERVFWAFEVFQHTSDRRELKRTVRSLQREYKQIIRCYAAKRAHNLLQAWPALWTFAKINGVQPTNHAERALRGAVIYRKLSLGSQSKDGEERIGRLLSTHSTCRLQCRSLFVYLAEVLSATPAATPCRCLREWSNQLNAYVKELICSLFLSGRNLSARKPCAHGRTRGCAGARSRRGSRRRRRCLWRRPDDS